MGFCLYYSSWTYWRPCLPGWLLKPYGIWKWVTGNKFLGPTNWYYVLQENPSTRPKLLARVLDSLPRIFAYMVYIRWVVLSRSEWENLRHANTLPYLLVDLFGQLPRGSMQIGIAGYCVMLFFDFIVRFREEVRPIMPILRVCMGKCYIFLALKMTTPCLCGTKGVPGTAT